MGGSGLIVVVIVAAWALFLVPQWMHRRASAAQHLADRIPSNVDDGDAAPPARRFGRRELSRSPRVSEPGAGLFSTWHLPSLPSLPSLTRFRGGADDVPADGSDASAAAPSLALSSPPPSAAARRRRVLSVLALATLLTAAVVGVATLAGVPVPAWVVAVPGGLMVGYLALLAVVRPGSHPVSQPVRQSRVGSMASSAADEDEQAFPVESSSTEPELAASSAAASPTSGSPTRDTGAADTDSTWTPVPLPTPTYVTAPRARSVRTIDLSNPGSWTAAPAADPAPATSRPFTAAAHADDPRAAHEDDYLIEHRRAVGD